MIGLSNLARAIGAAFLAATLFVPAAADAKPSLFRVWLQTHGTVATGQGNYFDSAGRPAAGFGGQVGLQLIVFEAFADVNVFDIGRNRDENTATMWNQLGVGLNVPIDIVPKFRLFGRANATYAFAPFASDFDGTDDNRGFTVRAGGGLEGLPSKYFALGAAAYGGYHLFGTRQNNDNGRHFFGQIYARFDLGF